ncbi:DNA polymerase IV [Methanoregula sp.]|uniref:DNA polymerase IV n=1 Tax=Methanoregula sp. TaxID=2052170 RepID=UPI000CB61C16|nr:DNA polymerase IV [Methanoregula sp.]PKG32943.1 MAG: DNA polymerase IV [Methanoregula sp.]
MVLVLPSRETGHRSHDTIPGAAGISDPAIGRIIFHLDMDSFYASVEEQKQPELAGKPVVIGADPKQGKGRGVVSTCSYEARKYGIRSAMPISQAYVLCPHAVFLPPDFPAYVRASAAVMAILKSYGFRMDQVSIDEAFLDISHLKTFETAQAFAEEVRKSIQKRLGLSCSIGIAPSRTIAKIASDFRKPGGLTIVTPSAARDFLSPLPVRRIPGVGKKAEGMLFEMGIRTIGDLARQDVQVLIGRFGRSAVSLHHLACGIDSSRVPEGSGETKSISRETTFETDTDDVEGIISMLDALVGSVSGTLSEENLRFRTLTLKIRYTGFITRNRSRSLTHFTNNPASLQSLSHTLFREEYDGRKIRLIGVRLSSFEKRDAAQATLPL